MFKPNVEKMKEKKDVKGLIKALRSESDYVRGNAAEALGEIGDARAVKPLTQAFEFDLMAYPYARRKAEEALVKMGDRAVEPLIQALKEEDEYVRPEVAKVLGNIRDLRAVEPLVQALKDEDWAVRGTAAKALGNLGDKRAIEPLVEALRDEDKEVRSAAKDALRRIRRKATL